MLKRVLGVAAATLSLLIPVATAAPAHAGATTVTSGCADVAFVGARGSGQPYTDRYGKLVWDGMGQQASMAARGSAAYMGGKKVRYIGIKYQAISIPQTATRNFFEGAYLVSVNQGISEMTKYLNGTARSCPKSKLVLIGYSQGAQVAHAVASRLSSSLAPRVSAVLIADPRRKAFDAGREYTFGTNPASNGMLTGAALPTNIRYRTHAFCNAGDFVCNSPANLTTRVMGQRFSLSNHTSYYTRSDRAALMGKYIWSMLVYRSGLTR